MTTHDESLDAIDAEAPETAENNSRRMALRALLAGGGAAAGVMAFGKTASAADNDPIIIGSAATDNDAQSPTTLEYDGPALTEGPSVFSVNNGPVPATAPFPANIGGYGNELVGNGVHGSTTNVNGFGVVAANLGDGDDSDPAPAGLAVASASGPQMVFVALEGAVEGPTGGVHVAGELYRDAAGTLWFTVPAPTEGDPTAVRFVKLAGTPTSGSFHAINPQRAYDSRQEGYEVNGVIAPLATRVISVANGHNNVGEVRLENAVPMGATAVQINVTATEPTGENYLAVTDGDTTTTETSLVNWDADTNQIANSITVPVNADREIRVHCGNQTGSVHFIVDVFGYYL